MESKCSPGMARFVQPRWMRISQESTIPTEHRHQGQGVILLADHLVVETEDVLPDEALRRGVVLRRMCRHVVHGFLLKHRDAPSSPRSSATDRLLQCRLLLQPIVKVCLGKH